VTESAGLLLYRRQFEQLEVFLVHPGGPFWANRDEGAWSIPKGELGEGEDGLAAARREFAEETGLLVEKGESIPLGSVQQKSGKVVHAWAVEGDLNAGAIRSNTFTMEWPPRSGQFAEFPEVDRGGWFDLATARVKLNEAQIVFLDRLRQVATG